jgi:hypothetical protein
MRSIVRVAALVVVILELGGIWSEIHQMRKEQVTNALYALPKERREALGKTVVGRRLKSTAYVDGVVSVNGTVELDQPVEVEIDR